MVQKKDTYRCSNLTFKMDSESDAIEECRRMGKSNYILKKLRKDILKELKDVEYISRQLNARGILNDNESTKVTSPAEGSTLSPEEILLDMLYTKRQDDVESFWNLLRETNHYRLVAKIEEKDRDIEILLQNSEAKEKSQYQLPAIVALPHPEDQSDTISVNQFKADVIATTDGIVRLIRRKVWGASPSKGELTPLTKPVPYVIFSHTASIGSYMTTLECVQACKQAQDLNMGWGWADIAFNFLVGNDGAMYEGRGWDYAGATAKGWNQKALGIAFIGKYVERMPSVDALDCVKSFLQYMVDSKILKKDFTIHCLRQVREQFPDAPGDMLYAKLQTWRGKGANTWSWREVEELEEKELAIPEEQQLPNTVKEKLTNQLESIVTKIDLPYDILDRLVNNEVITKKKYQKIRTSCKCDAEVSKKLLQVILCGKKEWFTIFLEALLDTNQRIIAKALWKSVPSEERKKLKRPFLRIGPEPCFKQITLYQITFDKHHDEDGKRNFQLGAGSFGVVLLASYSAMGGAKVAFKQIKGSEHGGMNDKDLRDFQKEAKTMYTLRHPDIVSIYGTICDKKEHVYGIVMEYMEVGSLDDLLTKLVIPWPVKVRMLKDVCRGLAFLNTPQPDRQYTVTHCDIKAKNILLNDRFAAKIADFGEAVLQNIATRSTGSKTIISDKNHGTVTHMAPELLNPDDDDDNYDPNEKTDVWSFGITIFEVCAEDAKGTAERRTPFPKKMRGAQITSMLGILKRSPFNENEMKKIPKDCPPFLITLMKSCSEIQKAKRFTFKDAMKMLEENYQNEFDGQIHRAMALLHKKYEREVLNLGQSDYEDDDDYVDDESSSDIDFSILSLPSTSEEPNDGLDEFDGPKQFSDNNTQSEKNLSESMNRKKRKSRKKELDILTKRLATLEKKVTRQLVDVDSLQVSVSEVSEAKHALQKEFKLVKETDEQNLIAPLEKKISEIEITVRQKIDEAKDEIIQSNEETGKKMEHDLEELELRLTREISRLSDPDDSLSKSISDTRIQEHYEKLVEDIDPKDIIDYLYQEILSRDEYEKIMAEVTTSDKNRRLLRYVEKKGDVGIKVLYEALKKNHNLKHLCQYLNITMDT